MASFRKRRRDGMVQRWVRETWNADTETWDFDYVWYDVPKDAPEVFMRERDPKKEGMLLYTVDEFDDDGQPSFPIGDFIKSLQKQE